MRAVSSTPMSARSPCVQTSTFESFESSHRHPSLLQSQHMIDPHLSVTLWRCKKRGTLPPVDDAEEVDGAK